MNKSRLTNPLTTPNGNVDIGSSSYLAIKTKRVTIGHVAGGANYNWATAANTTEQVLTIADVIPAFAKLVDVQLITTEAVTPAITTFVVEIGTSSSGNQIAASATCFAVNTIIESAVAGAPLLATSASAASLYLAGTPGANWAGMVAGHWTLLVTYIDSANLR